MSDRRLGRVGRLLRRSPKRASALAQLNARLDEQDAAIARLVLALDQTRLALDQRLLDHYALTKLAQAEMHLRADAIESALSSPDGSVAELLASEAALIDGYVIHHTAELGRAIAAGRGAMIPTGAGIDLFVRSGDFVVVVPSTEDSLVARILGHPRDEFEPGLSALLARELRPGAVAVDARAGVGFAALPMAAAVGAGGVVVCFEPDPHVAECLRRTLALNGCAEQAQVHAIAPPCGSLDAQVPAGRSVDLVRLDLRGGERAAWRATDRLRAANPGIVFVLAWCASLMNREGTVPAEFIEEIRAAGFETWVVDTADPEGRVSPLTDDLSALEGANVLLRRA